MCEFCEEKIPIITHYGKFKIDKLSNKHIITCDLNNVRPLQCVAVKI